MSYSKIFKVKIFNMKFSPEISKKKFLRIVLNVQKENFKLP